MNLTLQLTDLLNYWNIILPLVTFRVDDMAESRRTFVGGPRVPYNSKVRSVFDDDASFIYAWPSRGGVIVLQEPEAIDFEFLGLDPLDPLLQRSDDQDSEDDFSKRLLLLGAKWWDSEERFRFAAPSKMTSDWLGNKRSVNSDNSFRDVWRPDPTMRERRWVKVGWPSTGGLWVSEFETSWGPGKIGEIGRFRVKSTD